MSVPRVAFVHPVPMPYMFPVLRLVAASGELELTVLYARRSLAARGEAPNPARFGFPHVFLADAGRVFVGREIRELDFNPGLPRALDRLAPDLVVVSGFVQPTALLGIGWARVRRRPYGVLVESHEGRCRGPARRALRRSLAGSVVRRAGVLFPAGEAAAESLALLGASRSRMASFPHVPDPETLHDRGRDEAGAGRAPRPARAPAGRPGARVRRSTRREQGSPSPPGRPARDPPPHRRAAGGRRRGPAPRRARRVHTRRRLPSGAPRTRGRSSLLRAADVAVSPSLDEPWGTFPLEAAASGCAIVATERVPSAVELAGRHGAARLVRASHAGDLALAVIELLEEPGAVEALARRARAAAGGYTPEAVASSFLGGVRLACNTGEAS